MSDSDSQIVSVDEDEADFEYLCQMGLFEIEQAFLDAVFDEDGNEVEPE